MSVYIFLTLICAHSHPALGKTCPPFSSAIILPASENSYPLFSNTRLKQPCLPFYSADSILFSVTYTFELDRSDFCVYLEVLGVIVIVIMSSNKENNPPFPFINVSTSRIRVTKGGFKTPYLPEVPRGILCK